MNSTDVFDEYRMLGSVMDAEDVVQEAYLRWQGATEEPPLHQVEEDAG